MRGVVLRFPLPRGGSRIVIDPHAHIAPLSFIEDVRRGRFGRSISIEQGKKWELLVSRTTILGQERVVPNPLPRESFDMALRLKDMKRTGVDMQILSVVPPMTYYALDAGLNTELSAALNDAMLQVCEEHPGRFRCMAQVPLQAPKAAAASRPGQTSTPCPAPSGLTPASSAAGTPPTGASSHPNVASTGTSSAPAPPAPERTTPRCASRRTFEPSTVSSAAAIVMPSRSLMSWAYM